MKKTACLLLLLILLLVFHQSAIIGTKNGLLLWYQILIPSLLPFILITNALSETGAYMTIPHLFHSNPPNHLYEITAVLLGNLFGYPIGGKIINDFIKNGFISDKTGNAILALSSQASPMFLIGYVHLNILKKQIPLSIFLISIYLPVILLFLLRIKSLAKEPLHAVHLTPITNITDTFMHAVNIMVIIGLYVIIFSIIFEILAPVFSNDFFKPFLCTLEITNGLRYIQTTKYPLEMKLSLEAMLVTFGGFCSSFQIFGIVDQFHPIKKRYFLDKIILSTSTFLLIYLYNLLKM